MQGTLFGFYLPLFLSQSLAVSAFAFVVVMLYVDGYALEIVISTFNDCELDKAIYLSRSVYNDSMATIKMKEVIRSRYVKYVYFDYSHARKCKQRDR